MPRPSPSNIKPKEIKIVKDCLCSKPIRRCRKCALSLRNDSSSCGHCSQCVTMRMLSLETFYKQQRKIIEENEKKLKKNKQVIKKMDKILETGLPALNCNAQPKFTAPNIRSKKKKKMNAEEQDFSPKTILANSLQVSTTNRNSDTHAGITSSIWHNETRISQHHQNERNTRMHRNQRKIFRRNWTPGQSFNPNFDEFEASSPWDSPSRKYQRNKYE